LFKALFPDTGLNINMEFPAFIQLITEYYWAMG